MARIFHDRDPYWRERIAADLPRFVRLRGAMKNIGYRSDKWEEVEDEYEYIHKHDLGVGLYEACGEDDPNAEAPWDAWAKREPSTRRWPSQWACLGDLWKVEFEDVRTGSLVDAAIPKGMWLLCSPASRILVCVHPRQGFFGMITGGKMHVTSRGIEG